ncbi:DHHC palmitoyltransferase-domain-containing protein [Multifurca ochricompacta]|uniref:Palmitoyltransferase n=1 Tax=Multifurca ochricompacta TaxID=376703 RepID=A0AAD4LW26_9AGAM|nr:DHHC palmitoyltransferase-domain-containing protein [Multifurca ochricompacta]
MQSHHHHHNPNYCGYGTFALESCIQVIVIAIIGFGWYASLLEVGVGWLLRHEKCRISAVVYMVTVGTLFPSLAVVYLQACSGRATHSVPVYTAPVPESITEPYECRFDGGLNFCSKDNRKMRWKLPGAHHCAVCGVCRLGFEHHCPLLGNCVTTGRLKNFLAFLILTSVTVPLASLPVLPVLRTHVVAALGVSHADAWAVDVWWDRPYSWILCGGPLGRWVVGILLGFRVLHAQRIPHPYLSGSLIAQPHTRVVVLVGAATLIWIFAISMTVAVARDMTRGQTTLDTIRFRVPCSGKASQATTGRFVCILYADGSVSSANASAVNIIAATSGNSLESRNVRRIYPVSNREHVYDLCWRENWRRVLAQPLFGHQIPRHGRVFWLFARLSLLSFLSVYNLPKMNPEMIQRMLDSDFKGFAQPNYTK